MLQALAVSFSKEEEVGHQHTSVPRSWRLVLSSFCVTDPIHHVHWSQYVYFNSLTKVGDIIIQLCALPASPCAQDIRLARRSRLVEAWRVVTAAFTSYPLHLHRHIIAIIMYGGRCAHVQQ
jgi:hypothetical protein